MEHSSLTALGWDCFFEKQVADSRDAEGLVARVAAVDRNQLLLIGEIGLFRAKLSGKYMHESDSASERPCVGDWACVTKTQADPIGIVHRILERKTSLKRKAAGDSSAQQMIAANVDFVIIVQSCHYDFDLKRLERYLVMVRDGGARPCILLTKTDLVEPETLAGQIQQITSAGVAEPISTLSNVTGEGIEDLRASLLPGKTYCFVGSSGVGKSTIINSLAGQELLVTRAVSGTGEGRHATVRRELIVLDNGSMVIDSPGMRELGVLNADGGLGASFSDILALASQCRFGDCTHTNEPGCAVLSALERAEVNAAHYDNFIKLRRESEHYQLSYAEKRRKDKNFGRFIKLVKKDLNGE